MAETYKKINIRSAYHHKYTEFCRNQGITLKQATENLILYAFKHQIDLKQINENSTSSAKDLINRVGNKVKNLQNTYVSFQRTYEGLNNYLLNINLLMTYQTKTFDSKEDAEHFKKLFFEQAIMIRISTHPQQKLIEQFGGATGFYQTYLLQMYQKESAAVSKKAIFEIIEIANKLVNEVISDLSTKQK